jgi:hypothetical protein
LAPKLLAAVARFAVLALALAGELRFTGLVLDASGAGLGFDGH